MIHFIFLIFNFFYLEMVLNKIYVKLEWLHDVAQVEDITSHITENKKSVLFRILLN